MIVLWYTIKFDAISNYNIILSNFFLFIHSLKFRSYLASQKFLGFLASTTYIFISTTYLLATLHHHSLYIRNKNDIGLLTTWKYIQFFAKLKKTKTKKKKLQCHIYQPNLSNHLLLYIPYILVNYRLFHIDSYLFYVSLLYNSFFKCWHRLFFYLLYS